MDVQNSYQMDLGEIDEAKANGDKLFEKNGATVIIEKLSYLFVIGSRLDYAESMFMSGFQLNNPNVKAVALVVHFGFNDMQPVSDPSSKKPPIKSIPKSQPGFLNASDCRRLFQLLNSV